MRTVVTFLVAGVLLAPSAALAGLNWENRSVAIEASPADEQAKAVFSFTVEGEQAVTIESVRPSCGCTTAKLTKETYQPGEKGKIESVFTFGDRVGKQRKHIVVRTDDPKQPVTTLTLDVTIPQVLSIQPRLVYWRAGEEAEPKTVTLKAGVAEAVGITKVSSAEPWVAAKLEETAEGKQWKLTLTPDLTKLGGTTSAVVTIETDTPKDAPRSFTVFARVLGVKPAGSESGKPEAQPASDAETQAKGADAVPATAETAADAKPSESGE